MPWTDVFIPIEQANREIVRQNTWGHLAPKKDKRYKGRIVYAVGCFGDDPLNPTVLSCDLGNLDSSPWFFDALMDFLGKQEKKAGCVYEFIGTFCNYAFRGKIKTILTV